jgi:hypothetical protein
MTYKLDPSNTHVPQPIISTKKTHPESDFNNEQHHKTKMLQSNLLKHDESRNLDNFPKAKG